MIYCCGCGKKIEEQYVRGDKIYPHRTDFNDLWFAVCPHCHLYTGCHKGTKNPMGVIPTKEMRYARHKIHELIDPVWKSGKIKRRKLYKMISEELGIKQYHTGWTRSIEECRKVWVACRKVLIKIK